MVTARADIAPLGLQADEELGEPMVFAYSPSDQVAIVHYNHSGPRHTVIKEILKKIISDCPIVIDPMIRRDFLRDLGAGTVYRNLELSVIRSKVDREADLEVAAVADAIDAADEHGAERVTIRLSMFYEEGGLALIKRQVRKIADLGATCVDSAKIKYKPSPDEKTRTLDLLNARIVLPYNVEYRDRGLDRDQCRRNLHALYRANAQEVGLQIDAGLGPE